MVACYIIALFSRHYAEVAMKVHVIWVSQQKQNHHLSIQVNDVRFCVLWIGYFSSKSTFTEYVPGVVNLASFRAVCKQVSKITY